MIIQGDVTLCLNGCTLKARPLTSGAVKVSEKASLTICDCGNGGKITSACSNTNPTLHVYGTCTLKSGAITVEDATASGGCAVRINNRGVFTMTGGSLVGGKYGVYNRNVANLNGGTVSGVTAGAANETNPGRLNVAGSAIESSAGAAISLDHGSLDMTGGSASGAAADIELATSKRNNHENIVLRIAGGSAGRIVHRSDYPLYLSDTPTVTSVELASVENQLFASENGQAYNGSDIAVSLQDPPEAGETVIQGISGNADKFTYAGEGFELAEDGNGNLILQTPTTAPEHKNHGADGEGALPGGAKWVAWDGTTPFSEEFPANSDDTSDLYVYLTADVTYSNVSGFVDIAPNNQAGEMRNVHLCLNGHTISGVEDGVIKVKERTSLTICDCDEQARGTIQNTSTNDSYDVITASGDVTLYSGKLISNQEGINLIYSPAVTFRMKGGSIEAGDIAIRAGNHEGGVEIVDGEIRYGGARGIFISDGTVHVSGGTIAPKEDNSNESAAGIEFTWNTSGKLYLTGDPSITGKSAALSIAKPNTVYASENGQAYRGDNLTVEFTGNDTEAPIILDVNDNNAGEFTLVSPEDKTLVRQDNNLVLGVEAPVYDHTHGVDGTNGNPVGWTAWDGMSDLAANGYYYLADNVTLTETIQVRGDVHLCLNGKTLASTADYAVEVTEGHALTICDCGEGGSIERTHESGLNGCAVRVRGDFTLYGGSLENHGSEGYGILVMAPDGRPSATIAGGSVYSDVNAIQVNTASDVTLSGGQVSGKTSGVLLAGDGISFTMTGGSVTAEEERGITTNNYDITLSISRGTIHGGDAGIRLLTTSGGRTTISGGTITSKTGVGIDQKDLSGWFEEGNEATLILTGAPEIDSLRLEVAGKVNGAGYTGEALNVAFEKADAADGDIVIAGVTNPAKFNLTAPKDKILVEQDDNLVLGVEAPVYEHYHGVDGTNGNPVVWTAWNGTTDLENGAYYLTGNVELARGITVSGDAHLCLNGFKIEDAVSESDMHIVFRVVDEGSLTICDCSVGKTGKVTTSKDAVLFEVNGDLTLYGGMLQNLNGKKDRVTLSFPADSTGFFTMTGGTVTAANRAMNVDGAARISIQDGQVKSSNSYAMDISGSCTMEISGGTVSSPSSSTAIYVKNAAPNITISGGTVDAQAYGIQLIPLDAGGRVAVSGGTITSKTAAAIYLSASSAGTLELSGTPVLNGDTADLDLYVSGGVDGAGYQGDAVTVRYLNSKAQDGDTVIKNTEDRDRFTLTHPADKRLWPVNGNLLLGGATAPEDPNAHTHGVDGTAGDQTWEPWDGSAKMVDGHAYYLTDDVVLSGKISITGDVHLCLNGFTIDGSDAGDHMFHVYSTGSLTICDCSKEETGTITSDNGEKNMIYLFGGLTLYSGNLTYAGDQTSRYAVNMATAGGGDFIMEGGSIHAKKTAVFVDEEDASFVLKGGSVTAEELYALSIASNSEVTLSGGTLASKASSAIYIFASDEPTIIFRGEPVITGEKSCLEINKTITADVTDYTGEALTVYYGRSKVVDGAVVIRGTEEAAKFPLIYPANKALVASEGNLVLGEPLPDHAHGVDGTAGDQTWTAWDGSGSLDTDGYYYLTKDVSTTDRTGISVSADVHLCLNGFTVSGTERAFTVSKDASLTICDCSKGKTGKITSSGSYGYTVSLAGEMTLYGGEIANESTGDAVFLSMSGGQPTFTMKDGKVSSKGDAIMLNTSGSAATIHGGEVTSDGMGVELMSSASFTMTGGSITAGEEGVRVGRYAAKVTISGGSIFGGEEGDGGVYLNLTEGGTAAISGGSISAANGKGVLIPDSNAGVLTLSGAPTIDCLAMEVAGKVNGAGYAGAELDVSYESDNAQNGDIVIVGTTDLAKFNLTAPEGKILVTQGGNLVLGEETVEVPELVLSALPETVTYGDTFTLTATGGGEGALTWAATGAASVDEDGTVTITGAGSFTITATKGGKEATATGTAAQKAVTIAADDKAVALDAPAPAYTLTVTGALPADLEAIEGAYTLACGYAPGDPAGTYAITVRGSFPAALAGNYAVTVENGVLTVSANLAAVAKEPKAAAGLVYTGKAQQLITAGEAENGVMVYSLDGTRYAAALPAATDAGTYTVYYKVLGDAGYADTAPAHFQVVIAKAKLTVKANDIWVYAGNTPKFTATIKGYVNGEDWRVLKGELTFTCGYSQKYSKPGSRYTITPKGLTADNYDITFKTGTLTVKDPLSPRFNVYVLDSKHGTVEADCRYARKGDVVTLTIKPDWGYELETLTVTDSHGYELKLTYHSNGTYTFTMPRDNVTVKAIFTVRDMPFVDVPGDAWYAGGVRYVYAHGLMNGTGNWRFSPNRTTTRAMIATILYRMEGSPRVYGTSQFGDVEAGSWYEDAVIWATQNDIVEGYTSKTFGPNDPITREQMAAMLYRYADYCRCDMSAGRYVDLSKFSDMDKISDYAIPALRWAVGEEIIEGRTGKRLAPTDTATRAEVAVMLMRFCEDVIW